MRPLYPETADVLTHPFNRWIDRRCHLRLYSLRSCGEELVCGSKNTYHVSQLLQEVKP